MVRPVALSLGLLTLATLASCSRAPAEAFALDGLRDSRVVFVSDTSDVAIKDESTRFKGVPFVRVGETPATALRAATGKDLATWGSCGAKYMSKSGSFDVRMGLSRQADGWNVGNAMVLRNYVKTTGTDYIVLLNKLSITRADLERMGAGNIGRFAVADAVLDLSVIDARGGKRVWRSQAQGRAERADSLEFLARDAIRMAVDNFFTSLPDSRRWSCPELGERFK